MQDQSEDFSDGSSHSLPSRIEKFLNSNLHGVSMSIIVVIVMVLAYFSIFSVFTVLRHDTFKTNAFDLGIYNQALYTTLFRGRFFYETPDLYYTLSGSFFGVHFAPNTFFLLPFYYAFPRPETLLILQSAILSLTAVPIYYLSLTLTRRKVIATSFAALYLSNPFIHSLNTYDFHIEVFIPLFSMLALYFLETKKWNRFIVFSLLVGTTIDFGTIITFFLGLYGLVRYPDSVLRLIRRKVGKTEKEKVKEIRASIIVMLSSFLLLVIAVKTITMLGPAPLSSSGIGLFSKLGGNYVEILVNSMTQPWRILDSILYDAVYKFPYLSLMFLSTFFFAYYSTREIIICIPWVGVTLLTTNNALYQPGYQFGAFIIPFIFFASIHGVRQIQRRKNGGLLVYRRLRNAFAVLFVMAFLISPLSPIPYYFGRSAAFAGYPFQTNHTALLTEAVGLIPDNASVFAQNNIFAHVSNRVEAYVWIPPNVVVDYAIADRRQQDYFTTHAMNESFQQQFEGLQNSGKYQIVFNEDDIVVLRRVG